MLQVKKADTRDAECSQQQRLDEYNLHVDAEHDSTSLNTFDRNRRTTAGRRSALDTMNSIDLEWLLLCYTVDRLTFLVYLLAFIFMSILYL